MNIVMMNHNSLGPPSCIKAPMTLGTLAFFSSSLKTKLSFCGEKTMTSEVVVRSSVPQNEILDILLGAGLGSAQTTMLLEDSQTDQRSGISQQEQSSIVLANQRTGLAEQETEENQSAQPSSEFERSIVLTLERMNQRLDELSSRVGLPNSDSTQPVTASTTPQSSPAPVASGTRRNWADIPVDEMPDLSVPVLWDEDPEEGTGSLLQVSETTGKALRTAFTRPLSNQARLQVRKPYAFPNVEATKCPKLDPVAKQLLQKEQKQADASLARLQTMVLDALASMVQIVEGLQKGDMSNDQAADAAKAALTLLGNASAHISRERRKKAILCLNKRVHPLAEEEEVFADAAPLLLGKAFENKMKEHLESLKCLASSREREDMKNFQRGHSHYPPRGSGNFRRGGGNQQRRFQPYKDRKGKENFHNFQRKQGKKE